MATAWQSNSKPMETKCNGNNNLKGFSSHHDQHRAVVWEWQGDTGTWKPYSAEVSHLLERAKSNGLVSAYLGDASPALSVYTVNFITMQQQNQNSLTFRSVRRQLYPGDSVAINGCKWVWSGDAADEWHSFAIDVQGYMEDNFQKKMTTVDLEEKFPYLPYRIDFRSMSQVNKASGFKRMIRRLESTAYPVTVQDSSRTTPDGREEKTLVDLLLDKTSTRSARVVNPAATTQEAGTCPSHNLRSRHRRVSVSKEDSAFLTNKHLMSPSTTGGVSDNAQKNKKAKASTARSFVSRLAAPARALVSLLLPSANGCEIKEAATDASKNCLPRRPTPYTPHDRMPVPDVKLPEEICVITKDSLGPVDVNYIVNKYTSQVERIPPDEDCCICCAQLSSGSAYDDSTTVVSLLYCNHHFHQACLEAMYNSGLKDGCIQCPTCKLIHGVKYGNQPEGEMDYYVVACSLPDYADCGTICLNYSIPSGIQGADHPTPGAPYTARGFPRRCYLPDNADGRKVLRLLVTAWERRLVFTIGSSSTTGELNTVTWNEIHHKTEFGSNWSGHGFPDPHYIPNVLQELALQGVVVE